MSAAARLLVRLPNHLGDVLMARPLIAAVRDAFAEVRWVAPAGLSGLLAGELAPDHLLPWPSDGAARARAVAALRAWDPSAALVMPPSFSAAWMAWRAGAPVRVGWRGEWREPLLTHALARVPRGDLHLAEEYLALGEALGVKGAGPVVGALVLPPSARAALAALPGGAAARDGRPYAVLAPGALYGPAKRWPAERFAEVGRWLTARGFAVVVAGTAAEGPVCGEVAAEAGAGATSVAGATDLPALAALVAGAGLAVCNDSGLAHLAAAVGAPTVAVFGSTSSAWTAPLGPRVTVVQRTPVCAPCFRRTCRVGYRCLDAVTTRDVLRACEAALTAGRAA